MRIQSEANSVLLLQLVSTQPFQSSKPSLHLKVFISSVLRYVLFQQISCLCAESIQKDESNNSALCNNLRRGHHDSPMLDAGTSSLFYVDRSPLSDTSNSVHTHACCFTRVLGPANVASITNDHTGHEFFPSSTQFPNF